MSVAEPGSLCAHRRALEMKAVWVVEKPGGCGDADPRHSVISWGLLDILFLFLKKPWGFFLCLVSFFCSGSGTFGEELIGRLIQSSCGCSRKRQALGNSSWLAERGQEAEMLMAQVLLSSWRGSASAESFSRPCCCPGPWKPQRGSPAVNLIALFSLLLVALRATLGGALKFDNSLKDPGKMGG